MQGRVSIILTIYNTQVELLGRAVDSVLNQTYSNVELILLDDNSTDAETLDYLGGINSNANCDVLVYRKKRNEGKSDSLNIGIQKATGDYYCILDHDDYFEPDYVEKMISCAEESDADLVVGGMKQVDENGVVISTYPRNPSAYNVESYPWMSAVNLARMIKRSIVVDNGITYPVGAWTEDIVFTAKIFPYVKRVVTVPYEGYVNYINSSSTSRSLKYYALVSNQIPFKDIEEIIIRNQKDRHAYVCGLMNNEMMLIGYTLTAFSDRETKKLVILKFSELSRKLRCTRKELKYYDAVVGTPSSSIRILERLFRSTNLWGIPYVGYGITELIIRKYYSRLG